MIKWFFQWMFRLAILVVVLIAIFLLSLNTILRVMIEHNIREKTGLDAEIGRFELGWTEPTIEIQDLKIYNPANFGGTTFLDIPEIHIEYDREALLKKEIHLTLLRFNLDELDIVRDKDGHLNVFTVSKGPPNKPGKPATVPSLKAQTGYEFRGIDTLNVSFNKAMFTDLQNPANNRTQVIGIKDLPVPDVKSPNDLAGLFILIELRSNHFFDQLIAGPGSSPSLKSILKVMDSAF
jgi:uncharacterized protein involved in outer membrane biogenesis